MGLLSASGREQWRNPFAPSDEGLSAFLSAAADSASFGFGDELMGVGAGIGAALRGDDFGDAYGNQAELSRQRLRDAYQYHPEAAFGGAIMGALPMGGAIGIGARALRSSGMLSRLARMSAAERASMLSAFRLARVPMQFEGSNQETWR